VIVIEEGLISAMFFGYVTPKLFFTSPKLVAGIDMPIGAGSESPENNGEYLFG